MPVIDPDLFQEKVKRILAPMYGGMHNVPGKLKFTLCSDFQMAEINLWGDLSTFDFDRLTCLVLGAHKECIRCEVTSAMRYLKLRFHPRLREGGVFERHPTIEQAIELFNRR